MTRTLLQTCPALRCAGRSLLFFATVLAPSIAQRPTAAATGTLQACSPVFAYTGAIPPAGVGVGGACNPSPFLASGYASVNASCSDNGFALNASGSASLTFSGSYAMQANTSVLLQAPVGANLLLPLTHQSTLSIQPR